MKFLKALIIALLITTSAHAQSFDVIRNDNAATTIQSNNLGNSRIATNEKGVVYTSVFSSSGLTQSVVPVSTSNPPIGGVGSGLIGWESSLSDAAEAGSTTTVINATSHSARVGDVVLFFAGANTNAWSTISATDTNTITVSPAFSNAPAAGNGFYILRPLPIFASNPSTGSGAAIATFIDRSFQYSAAGGLLKAEDAAHSSGDAGVAPLFVYESAITASAATNDYGNPKADTGGRQIVTNAPAGETWYACTGAITDTTRTAIKAAVASNRIYVTDVTCINNSATPSYLTIEDGTTAMAVGFVGLNTGVKSDWSHAWNTPLRGTVNTALNVSVAQTSTSTVCCASGYISTI